MPNRTPAEETAGITKTPAAESPDPDTKSKLPKKKKDRCNTSRYLIFSASYLLNRIRTKRVYYVKYAHISSSYYVAWKELLLASALTVAVFIYARESPIKAAYYECAPPSAAPPSASE